MPVQELDPLDLTLHTATNTPAALCPFIPASGPHHTTTPSVCLIHPRPSNPPARLRHGNPAPNTDHGFPPSVASWFAPVVASGLGVRACTTRHALVIQHQCPHARGKGRPSPCPQFLRPGRLLLLTSPGPDLPYPEIVPPDPPSTPVLILFRPAWQIYRSAQFSSRKSPAGDHRRLHCDQAAHFTMVDTG